MIEKMGRRIVLVFIVVMVGMMAMDANAHTVHNSTSFGRISRNKLLKCIDPNPLLKMSINKEGSSLADVEESVVVTVSGVVVPSDQDWIGVFSAASHNYKDCPANKALYAETGDLADLPLLCDYPIKFKFLKEDPSYLKCTNSKCEDDNCLVKTCSASVSFRIINIRTDVTFVFFGGGLTVPCIFNISPPIPFQNPNSPLYAHISSPDSSATSMTVTWVSGSNEPQFVESDAGNSFQSEVTTFSQDDMCNAVPAPAQDFGWHNPGFIHSALITGLSPSTSYSYKFGSDKVGWSAQKTFTTPPAAASEKLTFIAYGDMGKAERDKSREHYVQVADGVSKENVDAVFHIGDISYATGFLAEWDYFLEMIEPIASKIPYMTAIGNHERDFPASGSVYETPDSGGECGVPYESYFRMPVTGKDKPWYSIEMGPVHFTVMSTENEWSEDSEQYNWIKDDLASIDRSRTPWVVFTGHRPMYASQAGIISKLLPGVDPNFSPAIEPLLLEHQVDLVLWGHVHNYERLCAVYQGKCQHMPKPDASGIHVYNSTQYSAPVHAIIGMAGFKLDGFSNNPDNWSLARVEDFGYSRVKVDRNDLLFEFVSVNGQTKDTFKISKPYNNK